MIKDHDRRRFCLKHILEPEPEGGATLQEAELTGPQQKTGFKPRLPDMAWN
jgi:hypothetical protein